MLCVHCETPLPDGAKFCTECGADPSDPGSSARTAAGGTTNLYTQLTEALGSRFELGELLGRGGMGAVFRATEKSLDRDVAIKVLPPEFSHDEKFVGRFDREAKTAAKLDHPGIIPIYSVEHAEGLYYFVMKHVTGRSLDDVLKSGPMPVDVCQRILWESACALGHAHQRGVVHRDIKPANIMIDDAGRAILMDFGISKASQAATQFTATGQVIGTPHYMSPEQAKGVEVDGRSDQYSLGVVAYRMVTGRLPFDEGSVHTVIYKHIFEDPDPVEELRPDVPPFLATAITRAMAKAPDDRFATMEEFATAVWPENPVVGPSGGRRVVATGSSITDAPTQITSAAAGVRKKKVPVLAIVIGFVAIGGGAAGAWWMWAANRSPVAPAAGQDTQIGLVEAPTGAQAGSVAAVTELLSQATSPPGATAPPPPPPPPPRTESPPAQAQQPVTRPVTAPAEVRPPPSRRPAPPRVGYITVGADPFGTLFVDGVEVGDTPVVGHELSPGVHIIEVRREGYRTISDTVQVVAGNTLRRRWTLIRQPS